MSEETIFAAALEKPPAERADYLAMACAGDTELRKRLEGLLAASKKVGKFMARPVVATANSATELLDGEFNPEEGAVTLDKPTHEDEDDTEATAFLSPSSRPDSLGRIGHYEVLKILGKGGFGIVYRAFDDVLQRVVAVKLMAPQLAATSPARKRFLREARTSAQIRHENVVQVYEVAEQPLPYLVMEFIPGETLQQRLDRTGPLDICETLRIGKQIAEGLAAAHATDLIHRDIKPANVLLEGGQQKVKITDFGLARAADDASISQSGIIAGTPMYMAPEQALGHKLDQRADLFSLGSVLYQMIAGRPPFRANSTVAVLKRVADDTPRDIREIIPETPQWLCNIVAKLHEKKPEDRYQSAREIAELLADCEQQLKAHGSLKDYSRIPGGNPQPRRIGRKWMRATAAVVLLLAVGMGAYAGPFALRYANDEGKVTFLNDDYPGDTLLVRRDGQIVATLDSANSSAHLASGEYELEAVCARCAEGEEVSSVIAGTRRLFEAAPGRGADGPVLKLSIRRGDRIRVGFGVKDKVPPPSLPDGWVRLFNGKDLTGWKETRQGPTGWKVERNVLKAAPGQTMLPSILRTERTDFRDFHLLMELRTNSSTRASIGIRSDGLVETAGYGVWLMDVDGKAPIFSLTRQGSTAEKAKPVSVKPEEWYQLEITAYDNVFQVQVDNQLVAKWTDDNPMRTSGPITIIQMVQTGMLEFRKIEIKEFLTSPPGQAGLADYREVHGVNRVAFDAWLSKVKTDGLVPSSIAAWNKAVDGKNEARYAAVAKRPSEVLEWEMIYQKQSDDRRTRNAELRDLGYRPIIRALCLNDDEVEWSDLWIKDRSNFPLLGMYSSIRPAFETRLDNARGKSRKPISVAVAPTGKQSWMYGDLYGPNAGAQWEVDIQVLGPKLDKRLEEIRTKKWRPENLAVYGLGTAPLYLALFVENVDGDEWSTSTDLTSSAFEQKLSQQKTQGFSPHHVTAREIAGQTSYTVIWLRSAAKKDSLPLTFTNSIGMEFVKVPKGKSWLGGGKDKLGDIEVEIPADLYLGKYEVTQEEWETVMGENPSHFSRLGPGKDAVKDIVDADLKRFPVENVSGDQCQLFVSKLNNLEKESGWIYRLPKLTEWEYACRGGPMAKRDDSGFDFYFARPTNTMLPEQANVNNLLKRPCKVGSYEPNALSLHDMHGNVWEWCDDEAHVQFGKATSRAVAGGCQDSGPEHYRAAFRGAAGASYQSKSRGLRLARVPSGEPKPEAKTPPPAVVPFDGAAAKARQEEWARHLGMKDVEFADKKLGMEFRVIPPGQFMMGAGDDEPQADEKGAIRAESPRHPVRITRPFAIGKFEVTIAQFRKFIEANPDYKTTAEREGGYGVKSGEVVSGKEYNWKNLGYEQSDRAPVWNMSWDDAVEFCKWLTKEDGRKYRLPTEAEWEWACRAGMDTRTFWPASDNTHRYAYSGSPNNRKPQSVGGLSPNAFGLHDTCGNVWEWCHDWFNDSYYKISPIDDPPGPPGPQEQPRRARHRVQRGGGTYGGAYALNSTARSVREVEVCGFRVVCEFATLPPTPPTITIQESPPATFKNSLGMEFVIVPKGKSWLGGTKDKMGDKEVEIQSDFYLGKYEVTQEEWTQVMGANPSRFSRNGLNMEAVKGIGDADLKRFPVESVSWDQCQSFVEKLNKLEKDTGWVYRLPKEMEWEYACRGGSMSDKLDSAFDYYFAKPSNTLLPDQANFDKGLMRTCKVGSYAANRLGLFDLHGNVFEWCDDKGNAPEAGLTFRGGGWQSLPGRCVANTSMAGTATHKTQYLGLRLARVPSESATGPTPRVVAPITDAK